MNKTQYDVIVAIISNGAPALSKELISALNNLIKEHGEMKEKLKEKTEE